MIYPVSMMMMMMMKVTFDKFKILPVSCIKIGHSVRVHCKKYTVVGYNDTQT
jgi:hypothetical protein